MRLTRLVTALLVVLCFSCFARAESTPVSLSRTSVTVKVGADCVASFARGASSPCTLTGNDPITVTFGHQDSGAFCSKVHSAYLLVEAVPRMIEHNHSGDVDYGLGPTYDFSGSLTGAGSFILSAANQYAAYPPWIAISDYAHPVQVTNPNGLCQVNPQDVTPYPNSFVPLGTNQQGTDPLLLNPGNFCYQLATRGGAGWGATYTKTYQVAAMWDDDPGWDWGVPGGLSGGIKDGQFPPSSTTGYAQYTMTIQCPSALNSAMTVTPSTLNITVGSDKNVVGNVPIQVEEKFAKLPSGTGLQCGLWPVVNLYSQLRQTQAPGGPPIHSNAPVVKIATWDLPYGTTINYNNTECLWDKTLGARVAEDAQLAAACGAANYGKTLTYAAMLQLEMVDAKIEYYEFPISLTCSSSPANSHATVSTSPSSLQIAVGPDGTVSGNSEVFVSDGWRPTAPVYTFGLDGQTYTVSNPLNVAGSAVSTWVSPDAPNCAPIPNMIVSSYHGFSPVGTPPAAGVQQSPTLVGQWTSTGGCTVVPSVTGKLADDAEFATLCSQSRGQNLQMQRTVQVDWQNSVSHLGSEKMSIACAPLEVNTGNLEASPVAAGALAGRATPVSISAAFASVAVPINGVTRLSFTVQNPGDTPATSVHVKATLPPGLLVALPSAVSSSCGGRVTAVSWTGSAEITNGSVQPHGSCVLSLNVSATSSGQKTANATVDIGAPSAAASAGATVNVNPPPSKPPTKPQPPFDPGQRRVKA